MRDNKPVGASFRDPSGFLFARRSTLYRQINLSYQENYDRLMESGLYSSLTKAGFLIPHQEVEIEPDDPTQAYKVICPESIQFISYPYEWCFSQLKDAALTTLKIQQKALAKGMTLKDSSAYNLQFHHGHPVLIDTLSFEIYQEGTPWVAYRQFCQHFLAPLSLMAFTDVRLSQLLRTHIDGIPLDLASALLPAHTRLNIGLLTNLHLHAKAQQRYADRPIVGSLAKRKMSRNAFLGLIDSLEATVRKLRWKPAGTEWGDYYTESAGHYSAEALAHKQQVISQFLDRRQPIDLWDLGANTGLFSRLASDRRVPTIAFDIDPAAVEQNYLTCVKNGETYLLPLVLDLTNPSPAIGWHLQERFSLLERAPVDAVLALALIHHLAISNNVPLDRLANFFHSLGKCLIIEFIPKSDSQVQRLLATREDIFRHYTEEAFRRTFSERFTILDAVELHGSKRKLFLMEAH